MMSGSEQTPSQSEPVEGQVHGRHGSHVQCQSRRKIRDAGERLQGRRCTWGAGQA